ncbi:hypothetical protein GEI7407_0916 [Geitlerinema sp. PCC 7407]|nr:hypothetical protein GEI7407_0916 [Geitlerinema sp. PCC 7407]
MAICKMSACHSIWNPLLLYLLQPDLAMTYRDIPLLIPALATVYLLTVYVLLALVQRARTWRRPQG